ncbi:cyclase family protein [Oscillibacter sp.]|uniref:cyclase family protein n=1 Tax=Oscillibacter sp. TaxID=1945593 RepID=UPI00263028CA|nr:cyclase family protein [Oscillibacter sp.]MDD3347636.1 cyclase family protein [Oscillibacter sp.]
MSLENLQEALRDMDVVELGQYLEDDMPAHPSHSKFYKVRWHGLQLGDGCNDFQLIMNEHNGTHVDSFGHYINKPGFEMIDRVPLIKLCGPCVTVDASFLKEHETLEKAHLMAWEAVHGPIREGDGVLFDFGWMRYWALRPNDRKFCHDYPGVGESAAAYLVEKKVRMVGVDTLSVDKDMAGTDPAHNALLSHKIPVVENLRNLDQLHDRRGYFVALPLLIRDGSASPVRPVMLVDRG